MLLVSTRATGGYSSPRSSRCGAEARRGHAPPHLLRLTPLVPVAARAGTGTGTGSRAWAAVEVAVLEYRLGLGWALLHCDGAALVRWDANGCASRCGTPTMLHPAGGHLVQVDYSLTHHTDRSTTHSLLGQQRLVLVKWTSPLPVWPVCLQCVAPQQRLQPSQSLSPCCSHS